jgi:acyl dehydratase
MRLFGPAWLSNGILDIKIVNSVYVGDTVRAKATLQERHDETEIVAFVLDVWCENQHGDTVIAGTASCRLPTRSATD